MTEFALADNAADNVTVSGLAADFHLGEQSALMEQSAPMEAGGVNSAVPKPKRLACIVCRKRKLKCDGSRPSCSTCSRLGHSCAYDEVRKKSGPKRGYVKALEERLKQVETLLKAQDPSSTSPDPARPQPFPMDNVANPNPAATANFQVAEPSLHMPAPATRELDCWQLADDSPKNTPMEDFNFNAQMPMNMSNLGNNFTWEMIGLGLEEPLPPQETIDELHQTYFEKVHPTTPMIHRYRYLAAMNLPPAQRPPVCLRYAMWTLACTVTDKYHDLKDLFYQRARKYVESDYVKGYGEHIISLAHTQTHILLASYEFRMMYFPRAWMSTGAAVRLSQMIGLQRLDSAGLDVKVCLPPPRDWTEKEERRRTFWMAFCEDRYASIGTGWNMSIDEKDILTNMPASEEAFELSRPEEHGPLEEALSPAGAGKLSSFGTVVLMASLFGRNLVHLHRPDSEDRDHDLHGEFWKRHRAMDNILLNTSLCFPEHLKIPAGLGDPNAIFANMCIHTSTICLHQAAIFKADKNKLPASVSAESKVRCITAASETASIMRMVSHLDLSTMNSFIAFSLYVAARVFVQYLKSKPDDSQIGDSLRFLLTAMNALKRRNPLTESFLVQLDIDLEALSARIPKLRNVFPRSDGPGPRDVMAELRRKAERNQCLSRNPREVDSYRNDCLFTKANGDNGNIADAPNLVEPDPDSGVSKTPSSNDLGSQTWTPAEEFVAPQPPICVMNVPGISYRRGDVDVGGTNDMHSTSPDRPSNRLTPNSSANSEPRSKNLAPGPGVGLSGSGGASFESSPASPNNINSNRGVGMNGVDGTLAQNFFGTPTTGPFGMPAMVGSNPTPESQQFSISTGEAVRDGASGCNSSTTVAGDFPGIPAGWADVSSESGMSSLPEGVFRTLMSNMGMETMDLGWETNP